MVNPEKIIRTDGTKVTTARHPSWKVEIYGLWVAVRDDPLIILLFPMFFASNWFYTWRQFPFQTVCVASQLTRFIIEFNAYNGYLFNIQARSLNNLVYWIAQIIGSILIGFLLDHKAIKRRARAFVGWGVLFVAVFAVHIWAYFYQKYFSLCRFCFLNSYTFIGITHAPRSLRMLRGWASMIRVTLPGYCSTSSSVFWTQCGRSPHIGSLVPCLMTQRNLLTSRDYVCHPFLSDKFVTECPFLIRQVYSICWWCWYLAC